MKKPSCDTCQALEVELGLARNRIRELEEINSTAAKHFAAVNNTNGKLMAENQKLCQDRDISSAHNLEIVREKVRNTAVQLGMECK